MPGSTGAEAPRGGAEALALEFAERGVQTVALRFAPTVHGHGDHGFMAVLVDIARRSGVSGYVGDGANRWPAVHRSDAGRVVAKVLENPGAARAAHAVGEEGVAARDIAEAIGRGVGVPIASIAPGDAESHFGWIGGLFSADIPASSVLTQERFDWRPVGPTLLDDLAADHYFASAGD